MLTIIGLGPAGKAGMSQAAWEALIAAPRLVLRTSQHPAADDLNGAGCTFETLDHIYSSQSDFNTLYPAIAHAVMELVRTGPVVFAVPGNPLVGEESVRLLLARAAEEDVHVSIVGSQSFVEPTLRAVGTVLQEGLLVMDALTVPLMEPRVDLPTIFYQVYDTQSTARLKLHLLRWYPPEFEVMVVQSVGCESERVVKIPLHRLDRIAADHLTSLFLPVLPACDRQKQFVDLVQVMATLRGEGGCPWDREQNHQTLKRYMIEECYEALEAIDQGNPDLLCEELGDVLLQVVFHAQLEAELGVFEIGDVIGTVVDKLIRRHPHVFGTTDVAGSDEVLVNWERIKRAEKPPGWRSSALDGIPVGLPALMLAMEVSKRAAKVGFEWNDEAGVLAKLDEELKELRRALDTNNASEISSELGDVFFTLVNLARWRKLDAEEALRQMVARFRARFTHMESAAAEVGRTLEQYAQPELEQLWSAAKQSL